MSNRKLSSASDSTSPLGNSGKNRDYGSIDTNLPSANVTRNDSIYPTTNSMDDVDFSPPGSSIVRYQSGTARYNFAPKNKNHSSTFQEYDSPFQPVSNLYDESQLYSKYNSHESRFKIVTYLRRFINYFKYGDSRFQEGYNLASSDKATSHSGKESDVAEMNNNEKQKKDTKLQGIIGKFIFSIFYLLKSTRHTLRIYLTSLVSLILSVIIIAVLYQTIQKSNIIFLYIAEGNAGEMDFIWQRRLTNVSTEVFLNQTKIENELDSRFTIIDGEKVKVSDHITGLSSRWMLPGYISNMYNRDLNSSAIFLLSDTKREAEIGLGRNWNHRPLGIQEAHVRDVLLKAVDAKPNFGEEVFLSLDIRGLIGILNGESLTSSGESTEDSDSHSDVIEDNRSTSELLHDLLERAGFDFSQVFVINVTRIAEEQHINIPEPLKPIIDQFGIIEVTGEQAFQLLTNGTNTTTIGTPFRVVDSVEGSDGYFPSSLGNVVLVDSSHMAEVIRRTIATSTTIQFLIIATNSTEMVEQFLSTFKLSDFSLMLVGLLKDRFAIYEKSSDDRDRHMLRITDEMIDVIGMNYPISTSYPLVEVMELSNFLSLFLNQIFNTVLVILAILACVLLNMLLMSNIDDHVYEYGMLRALGLDKFSLIGIIFAYAFMFAIPGVIIGLILAFLVNTIVQFVLSWVINLSYIDWKMSPLSIIIPTVVGLAVPTLANIVPARRALSRSLRDALDLTFQTFNQTTVTMVRLEKMGLQPWQTILAIILVVAGFIVYYMIPYAFTFQDFSLFFFILNGILLAMKIGLCLVAVILQPYIEKIILFFILIGPERRLRNFIQKNMAGHRNRSRQTFIMFTIATAFVIFAGVSFSLQTSAIVQNAESIIGGDIVAMATSEAYPLPESSLTELMEDLKRRDLVDEYSYVSYKILASKMISRERLSALASYPLGKIQVFSVSENYLRATMSNYFLSTDIDSEFDYNRLPDGKPDIVRSLYVDGGKAHVSGEVEGFYPGLISSGELVQYIATNITHNSTRAYSDYLDVILSTATKETHSIDIDLPALLTLTLKQKPVTVMPWLLKPKAFVYKFPGFVFSSYSVTSSNSPLLISEKDYEKCLREAAHELNYNKEDTKKYTYIRKNRLIIKMKEPKTSENQAFVLNGLRSKLNSERSLVQSVEDVVSSTATAETILNWSFNALAFIACILCFLNLVTAFTANVKDNQWIYGVLRALGMTGFQLTRAYIYEALCLVLAAFFCGTFIGTTLAVTLVLQQNLFLQNPLVFDFPWILFFFLLSMAVIVAVLGSCIPSRNLQKKEIAYILKGL